MGGYPIPEEEPGGIAPTPVSSRDQEWDAIIKKLEGDIQRAGKGAPSGGTPGAPAAGPTPGQLAAGSGQELQQGTGDSLQPLDPLGISGMEHKVPPGASDPGRAALTRNVLEFGRKGSQTIGGIQTQVGEIVDDFPKTLPEFMDKLQRPENVRGLLRGSGGAAGGMIGFGMGGPGGAFVGTGAGSAVGGYLANSYDAYRNWALQTGEKPETVVKLMQPAIDAALDADISGGIIMIPGARAYSKHLLSRLLRLPPNSRELMDEAATLGVDLGVANVASGGVGKGAVNVFGRMPIIGGSAGNAAQKQAKAVTAAYEDMFEPLLNQTASTEIGQAALLEARKRYQAFAVPAIKRYEHALRIGEEQGAVLPTDRVLKATGEVLAAVTSKSGKLQGALPADMKSYLNGIVKNLEGDKMSVVDANNILIGVETMARRAMGEKGIHYSKLDRISEAIDMTLKESGSAGSKLLLGARQNFKEGLEEFQSSIYKKMVGTVDRNIFALGKMKESTITADEFVDMVDKIKTPKQIVELRAAAGDAIVRNAARTRLDDAWVKATGAEPGTFRVGQKFEFDADRFNQSLGLDKFEGQAYNTMKEMLRGSGITIDDVAKLSRVAEAVGNAPIQDASTFMARAAVLRGAGGIAESVKAAMTFGAAGTVAATAGLPQALASIAVLRWGVGKFMQPGLLKLATTAMDPNTEYAVAAAAVAQMANNYPSLFNE